MEPFATLGRALEHGCHGMVCLVYHDVGEVVRTR